MTTEERFWAKVDRSGECWIWTAGVNSDGYGIFWDGKGSVRSHRFSYELATAPIPDGLLVLHNCDTRSCVRPEHLFLGTHIDNVDDRNRKGRQARGGDHVCAKLTESAVVAIRRDYAQGGLSYADMARRHGVAKSTIWQVIKHRCWTHVPS